MEPYDHTSTDTPNLLKQSYLDITDPAQPTIKRRFIEQLPQKVVEELSTWPKTTYKNQGKKYTGIICPNYKTVDVAQLLKHIFGLMNTYNDPRKFMLLYLYYKADNRQENELKGIKEMLTEGCRKIQFDYISYQDYVARLRHANGDNQHLKYLSNRYRI